MVLRPCRKSNFDNIVWHHLAVSSISGSQWKETLLMYKKKLYFTNYYCFKKLKIVQFVAQLFSDIQI